MSSNSLPFPRTDAISSPTDTVPGRTRTECPLTSVHRHHIVGHKEQGMVGSPPWPNKSSTGQQENGLGKSRSRIGSQSGQCMAWS
ncbi:hypothetical protein LU604_19605 [Erwinia tracheiphila]|uniref:hypothetical protein n=1 Tax=Erwinia tracheiphila TaxID=65700 RepID=UPI001F44FD11|nr:hypothetical protein [Erwinia tracheiphila]UIA82671.1 hypothetical protein LU604_19605 [Erwinia tracheiphila]